MQEMQVWSLGQKDPLEKEMATHSTVLAWVIPETEEPGGLESTESKSRTRLEWLKSGSSKYLDKRHKGDIPWEDEKTALGEGDQQITLWRRQDQS